MSCDFFLRNMSQEFVLFGANMAHLEVKLDIHGLHDELSSLLPTTYTRISDLAHFWPDWHKVQQIEGPKEKLSVQKTDLLKPQIFPFNNHLATLRENLTTVHRDH